MISDRVGLLLDIIFSNKDEAEQAFDKLVPRFQSELYVLYTILDCADVLSKCELDMPNTPDKDDTMLSINIDLDSSDVKIVNKYIEQCPDALKPFRNSKPVNMEIESRSGGLRVVFNI